jgi:hypothetical protein
MMYAQGLIVVTKKRRIRTVGRGTRRGRGTLMPNMEAWNHPPRRLPIVQAKYDLESSRRLVEIQKRYRNDFKALYAKTVEEYGAFSPAAMLAWKVLRFARHRVQVALRITLLSVRNVTRHMAHLRALHTATWRLLLTMLVNGGPRKDPPLGVYETLCIPEGVPPWSPWVGLSPPAVPALIQRQ